MNLRSTSRRWPVRAAGGLAVAVFLVLVMRFWHPVYGFTAFIQLDASNDNLKIAAFHEFPVYVYRNTGGYDGLYYAQIAYHPTLDAAELRPATDTLTYRARRILPAAMAWLLAVGNPAWIVHVYSVLNVAAWLALAGLLWRLLGVGDARGFFAWLGVMFSAGALSSVRFALTDLVALAILAGAMLAAERNRRGWATGILAAAGLARETSLGAVVGIWERPWLSPRNLLRTLLAVAPLAAWVVYVRWRVGYNDSGFQNLTWPVIGYVEKWTATFAAMRKENATLVIVSFLALIGLSVQGAFFFTRWRPENPWWRLGALYAAFMLCLDPRVWDGLPGAATRVLLPLGLAFNLVVHRTRASFAWLVAGNFTIAAGLLALAQVHEDPNELAAVRAHGTAVVATLRDGWYDREHTSRHAWTWSRGTATVSLESWPKKSAQTVQLEFSARSLTSRTVTIREAGREIWQGAIGPQRSVTQTVTIHLHDGQGALEFSSASPATPESAGARLLAFALYDARLVVAEP